MICPYYGEDGEVNMNSFKMTKKNILMIKEITEDFDLIRKIVFVEDMNVYPYSAEEKINDIKEIYKKFGEVYKNG